jgi:hypothetical protein
MCTPGSGDPDFEYLFRPGSRDSPFLQASEAKRVKSVLLAVVLLFLLMGPLFAQVALMEAVFLPPRFFVGDRVELRLTYEIPAGLTVDPPAQLPVHAWVEYQRIEVQDRRTTGSAGEVLVRIFFIPFFSGETVLAPLQLGDLDTGELLVSTQSTLQLEQDQSLRGPRGQLNLPLTWLRLLTLVVAGIGAPFLVLFLLRSGIRGFRRIREARMLRLPYLHVSKSLNRLESARATMEEKSFFILLSLAIRRYLSERLSRPLMSVTTGEITRELSDAGLEESISRRIHEVLKAADLIKFSGKKAHRREMEKNLKAAAGIVEQVEERTAHVEA